MTRLADSPQLSLLAPLEEEAMFAVRESRRARRLAVRVFSTGAVEVVVPPRTSRSLVQAFVASHREWIDARRTAARRAPARVSAMPPVALDLPAFGERWRVHVAGGAGRARLDVAQPGLLRLCGSMVDGDVRALLRDWLVARARSGFTPLLARVAAECGFSYARLSIRRQKSRWGSCSTSGTISLNACLAFVRPHVVRYLMVHELAHTWHMNHSQRFWSLVGQHCPDYERLDRELEDGWRLVPSWIFRD